MAKKPVKKQKAAAKKNITVGDVTLRIPSSQNETMTLKLSAALVVGNLSWPIDLASGGSQDKKEIPFESGHSGGNNTFHIPALVFKGVDLSALRIPQGLGSGKLTITIQPG